MRRYLPLLLISVFLLTLVLAGSTILAGYAGNRKADVKSLTVYTTLPVEQVAVLGQEFEKTSNIKVNIIPLTDKDLLTRLKVESASPRADLVLASRDVLVEAKKLNTFAVYTTEETDLIPERFKDNDDNWIGLWFDPIVFAVNLDALKNMPNQPSRWADLGKEPRLRLAMTDFLAAEASETLLNTMTSIHGEEKTLAYLKTIHPQIVQYAKFLATPVRMAGMGEADLAIAVHSEALRYINDGFPLKIIYPEEGTAFWLAGAGLVQKALHAAEAKQFLAWLITDNAQATLQKNRYYFIPTNPELLTYRNYAAKNLKLWDYTATMTREQKNKLLDKWVQSVRFSPK